MASAQGGYQEGYEDERFESPVPENIRCAICLNILRQPMQCTRNEHFFCQLCITRHLTHWQRCPTCMEELTIQTLRPARFVKDLISQLNIRCDNADRGCAVIVTLETLESHVANCEFSPVKCSNDGCEVILNRKDQPNHDMNDCNFRQGKCEVCGKIVLYREQVLHCYVTKNAMDKMTKEMSSIKEILMDMSKEFTRHMGSMKDEMSELKQQMVAQMVKLNKEMRSMKRDMDIVKKKEQSRVSTCSEENWNVREDIIIAGGELRKSVEKFCWSTLQWSFLTAMMSERYLSSSFVHRDQMFVCGGMKKGDRIEILELKGVNGKWKQLQAKLPQHSYGHASIVYEENVFTFGGESSGKAVSDIYKVGLVSPYPSQLVSHLPEARSKHGAQRFGDKVAIVGGTTTGHWMDSVDKVLLYDIARNSYRPLAPLPVPICKMATVAWGGDIIIIGGLDKEGNALNTVVSYNISNEKSKMLPPMKQERSGCTAVRTGNVIVVMGGCGKDGELDSAESFSFDHYSWVELPSMNEKRDGATAVAVINVL